MLQDLELLEPLGRRTSELHRAQLTRSGRVVVVRRVPWHEEERAAAAGREAAFLATTDAPGLIGLIDVAEDEQGRTLVLDHVPGGSLQRHVAGHGPLGPVAALSLTVTVAETLRGLHERGATHGTLGPDHVLLDAELRPVLCDLRGVGRSTDPTAVSGDLAGLGDVLLGCLGGTAQPPDAAAPPSVLALATRLAAGDVPDLETALQLLVETRDRLAGTSAAWRTVGREAAPDVGGGSRPAPDGHRPPLGVPDDPLPRLLAAGVVVLTLAVPLVGLLV